MTARGGLGGTGVGPSSGPLGLAPVGIKDEPAVDTVLLHADDKGPPAGLFFDGITLSCAPPERIIAVDKWAAAIYKAMSFILYVLFKPQVPGRWLHAVGGIVSIGFAVLAGARPDKA